MEACLFYDTNNYTILGRKIVVAFFFFKYISLFPYTNWTYLRGKARPQARDLGDMSNSCIETVIWNIYAEKEHTSTSDF